MIKRLLFLTALGGLLSGCFMAPMALVGPAASGFTSASIIQSGVTTTANYMVKKSTGKSISEHALDAISKDILKQALIQYKGTLIVVSHDREFLSGLTNRVIEFTDNKIFSSSYFFKSCSPFFFNY